MADDRPGDALSIYRRRWSAAEQMDTGDRSGRSPQSWRAPHDAGRRYCVGLIEARDSQKDRSHQARRIQRLHSVHMDGAHAFYKAANAPIPRPARSERSPISSVGIFDFRGSWGRNRRASLVRDRASSPGVHVSESYLEGARSMPSICIAKIFETSSWIWWSTRFAGTRSTASTSTT